MLHKKFMDSIYPLNPSVLSRYIDMLNIGACYIYRRDKSHRPLLFFNMKKVPKLGEDPNELMMMSSFLLHFCMSRLFLPGKIENWICIFDLKGMGVTQIPKKIMKALSRPMQDYFKGRLYRLYICNSSVIIKLVWKIV